jgi:hypothetical protein
MKYTNYLINGNAIDFSLIENSKFTLKPVVMPFFLVIAICGVFIMAGMIPMAVAFDGYRSIRYASIKLERKHHMIRTITHSKPYLFVETNNNFILNEVNIVVRQFNNTLKKIA